MKVRTPAVLGGKPLITKKKDPVRPVRGPLERGAMKEVLQGQWYSFHGQEAPWRSVLEQTVSWDTGHRYGVGQPNGTIAIGTGLLAQWRECEPDWAADRTLVLVPDVTHASAHAPIRSAAAAVFGRVPMLVPVDAAPDGTMDANRLAEILDREGHRVLGIVYATMYASFGQLGRVVSLAERHGIPLHHDNALGGAAFYDGPLAPTASLSFQGEGKAARASEGGVLTARLKRLAGFGRAESDCGNGPSRYDHIPHQDIPALAAGNSRMGEPAAMLALMQWLRAKHDRVIARESRRQVAELLASDVLPAPILTTEPLVDELPPFFAWHAIITDALQEELGLTPTMLRRALSEEGLRAERGFVPTHMEAPWQPYLDSLGQDYAGSRRVYAQTVFIPTWYLRSKRFPGWMHDALTSIVHHAPAIRAIGDQLEEPVW